MKYRIKETIDGNGENTFVVEYEWLWIWSTYGSFFPSKEQAEKCIRSLQTKEVKYHTVNNNMENQNNKDPWDDDDDPWCACDTYYPDDEKNGLEICGYCESFIPLSTSLKQQKTLVKKEQYTYKIAIDDSTCAFEYEYVCDGSFAIHDIAAHIHSLLKAENELEGKYVEQ